MYKNRIRGGVDWRNSAMLINIAFPLSYFDQLGIPRLAP
jgi:hypothetical protein